MKATTRWPIASIAVALAFTACGRGGGGGSSMLGSTTAPSTSGTTGTTGTRGSTTSGSTSTAGGSTTSPVPSSAAAFPIDHVFIIFKENHTFDNYYAGYPGANGSLTAKTSKGTTVPLTQYTQPLDNPGTNGWDAAHADYNGGAMDQFDVNEGQPIISALSFLDCSPFVTYAPPSATPGGPNKYYWQVAQVGTLCDNYFTSIMACSSPNHMYSFAAQCGNLISNEDLSTHLWTVLDAAGNQVSHPNHMTPQEVPTSIANELEKKGLTWKYFAESQGFGALGQVITTLEDNDASIKGLDVVSSLPDFAQRYDDQTAALDTNLAALLAQGDVGSVTYIRPAPLACEHPGIGPVDAGADWTRKVVNEIGNSTYWNHCAILITWDDYGGWYDHVPPPQLDRLGLGFRVPCVVISPYAKHGFVDHTLYEHSSLCKLSETIFGLPAMSPRDAQSADMTDAFDFTQPPRSFTEFQF